VRTVAAVRRLVQRRAEELWREVVRRVDQGVQPQVCHARQHDLLHRKASLHARRGVERGLRRVTFHCLPDPPPFRAEPSGRILKERRVLEQLRDAADSGVATLLQVALEEEALLSGRLPVQISHLPVREPCEHLRLSGPDAGLGQPRQRHDLVRSLREELRSLGNESGIEQARVEPPDVGCEQAIFAIRRLHNLRAEMPQMLYCLVHDGDVSVV